MAGCSHSGAGCLGRPASPCSSMVDPAMPDKDPDLMLRWALAHVVHERLEAGATTGGPLELGAAIGGQGEDASLRVHASNFLAGKVTWPDRTWGHLATYCGYTRAGLLHAVAAKVTELEAARCPGPPKLRRGRPAKKQSP